MRQRLTVAAVLAASLTLPSLRAEILDRIAVTVGREVIAESSILLDLRVSAFLDGKPVDVSAAAKRKSAGRLVDQILILQEAADSHVTLNVDDDVKKTLQQIRVRYGSLEEYQAALARYGITEKDLAAQLADGFRTLKFTELRFRPEVQISEEELRANYNQLAAGWREKKLDVPSFENSRDQLEQLLMEQRTTDALDQWLTMTRDETKIIYHEQVIP